MIWSADELCTAVEETLQSGLEDLMTARFPDDKQYHQVKTWQQLPTKDALATAQLPGIAIASPGVIGTPRYERSRDAYKTTWRIEVACYAQGREHGDTQARCRNWVAGIRTILLANKTLGDVATGLSWAGEAYALRPNQNQARTTGGGVVLLDVDALVSATAPPPEPGLPVVLSTHPTLAVE